MLFGGIVSSSLTDTSRARRISRAAGAYTMYALLVLLGSLNLLVLAPSGWLVAAVLLVAELL
jgi:hypothetical protein